MVSVFLFLGAFYPLVFVMCWAFFVYFGFFRGASEARHWAGMLLFGLFSDILKKVPVAIFGV